MMANLSISSHFQFPRFSLGFLSRTRAHVGGRRKPARWLLPWLFSKVICQQSFHQVKVYMKSRVKQTEDHLSYTVLRWAFNTALYFLNLNHKYQDKTYHDISDTIQTLWIRMSVFSMVAEIGGYSGLLLGFSLMDTVAVFSHITKWMFSPVKPAE